MEFGLSIIVYQKRVKKKSFLFKVPHVFFKDDCGRPKASNSPNLA